MRRGRRQGCRICLSIAIRQLCRARGDTHGACVLLAQHAAAASAKGISHPVRRQWLPLADTSGWTVRTVRHDDRHTEAISRYTPAGTDCSSCRQLLHKGVAGADLAPDAVHSRVPGASLLHPSMECAPKRSASGSRVECARHGMVTQHTWGDGAPLGADDAGEAPTPRAGRLICVSNLIVSLGSPSAHWILYPTAPEACWMPSSAILAR